MKTFLLILWIAALMGAIFGGFLVLTLVMSNGRYSDDAMIYSAIIAIACGILPHAAATAVTKLIELADKK